MNVLALFMFGFPTGDLNRNCNALMLGGTQDGSGQLALAFYDNMAKVFQEIDSAIADWISRQKVFFVATAPLSGDGLVNCSPKGMETFKVIDGKTVAYLDLTGSGVETIAHLKENSRIVVMMCALEGAPRTLRLHGSGEVLQKGTDDYGRLIGHFDNDVGARSIVRIRLKRIGDSCGWGVPRYEYQGDRDGLVKWATRKGDAGIAAYQKETNMKSLDGLEGFTTVG